MRICSGNFLAALYGAPVYTKREGIEKNDVVCGYDETAHCESENC